MCGASRFVLQYFVPMSFFINKNAYRNKNNLKEQIEAKVTKTFKKNKLRQNLLVQNKRVNTMLGSRIT